MEGTSSESADKHRDLFLTLLRANKPAVLKNRLKTWTDVPWSIETLKNKYGLITLKFRVVHVIQPDQREENYEHWKSLTKHPVYESDCQCVQTTIHNFIEWVNGEIPENSDTNPFHIYPREDYWIYSSYNYMHEFFLEDRSFMKGVDWSWIGFPHRGPSESSFWLGSTSSNTPFHQDTYGCNIIAQLIGKKQWVLFPPEDDDCVYMTRIPFEESSIFSQVNVYNPDLNAFPLFKNSHPHVITLEPGDALFLPPKWWHFVTSVSMSLSINTWIEMDTDDEARLNELISKTLMSAFIPTFDIDPKEFPWINPGEELLQPEEVSGLMSTVLKVCSQKSKPIPNKVEEHSEEVKHLCKCPKQNHSGDVHSSTAETFPDVQLVPALEFPEYYEKHCYHSKFSEAIPSSSSHRTDRSIDLKSIVTCFVHPDVVACIAQKLKNLKS